MPNNLGIEKAPFLVLGSFIRNLGLRTTKRKKGPLGGLGVSGDLDQCPCASSALTSCSATSSAKWREERISLGNVGSLRVFLGSGSIAGTIKLSS